ncbi:hypothetical protein [Pantoea piersonii]|uniref:hypothetical protein n=1 Tax=Pantoea piersonii TaxID=2364647 RepID=UPI0028A87482|nr:hypothetical protein [Pantoea piersonii]
MAAVNANLLFIQHILQQFADGFIIIDNKNGGLHAARPQGYKKVNKSVHGAFCAALTSDGNVSDIAIEFAEACVSAEFFGSLKAAMKTIAQQRGNAP